MRLPRRALTLVVLLLVAAPVLAHVPAFPDDNDSPARAVEVPDPVKSWSFYDSLGEGGVAYYRARLAPGERFTVGTFTPDSTAFTPSLVVMSPALEARGSVPPGVTVPDGMAPVVVAGDRPQSPSYEPFAPSANFQTARFEHTVDAERTYLIAVYEPENRTGPAGVVVGFEEAFSPTEYLAVPVDLVRVRLWEGQSPLLALGPFLLTVLGGAGLLGREWRDGDGAGPLRWTLAGAGLLVLGSGVNTAVQTVLALARTGVTPGALVTAVFVAVPVLGGTWGITRARRPAWRLTPRQRVGLGIVGALSLLTWAGFIVGPVVLLGLAVVPSRAVPTTRTGD